jgi:hypothetical protein
LNTPATSHQGEVHSEEKEEKKDVELTLFMKRYLELPIKTLQSAPTDAEKSRKLLEIKQVQKEEVMHIEDTERLVTEIEMPKVVLS